MTQSEPLRSSAPTTAAAVANEFLRLGNAEPGFPIIDQMKLQKLVFYAHGWYLGTRDTPLFDEDFEAWPWGPVSRNIYHQTKKFGKGAVTERISEIREVGEGPLNFSFFAPDGVPDDLKEYIKQVWDIHKLYTGIQLSNSTHAAGEPWTIIKEQYGSLENKPTIPNQLIASVFREKALQNVSASSN